MNREKGVYNIITVLLTVMYALFTILNTYEYRDYVLFGVSILIFLLSKINNRNLLVHITKFHKYTFLFLVFCFASMAWAYNSSYAKGRSLGIMYILIMLFFVYDACKYDCSIDRMLFAVKWGGVIISIYTIFVSGISGILNTIRNGLRLEDIFANSNGIAVNAAISIVIFSVYILLERGRRTWLSILACIPCVLVIAASGSRKGIIILGIGILLAFYWYIKSTNNHTIKMQRFVFAIIIFFSLLFLVANTSLFSLILERMRGIGVGNSITKEKSAILRDAMIVAGWEQFLKTPILGIGIGCPRIINIATTGMDAYLHNNFIELLCAGGVVGFALYYRMYFYNIRMIIRNKDKTIQSYICLTILYIKLLVDWGMVSYYSETTYFILLMCFMHSQIIVNNSK